MRDGPRRRREWPWLVLACGLLVATGAAGSTPASRGAAAAFDAALPAWVRDDVAITARAYDRALAGAQALHAAVASFLDAPSDRTLRAAREAWRASRERYGPTEVFRFSDGPIDGDSALAVRSNIEGLALVLEGDDGAPGLLPLFHTLDPALAGELRERLDEVRQRILDIPEPFDAIILSALDDPRRHRYQALAGELIGLSGALRRAGERAGVTVSIGGGG